MRNSNNDKKVNEILELASQLIEIPAFSIGKERNIKGIKDCFLFITNYLKKHYLRVLEFKGKGFFPGLYCDAGDKNEQCLHGRLLLVGHYDRVSPLNQMQTKAVIRDDLLEGRGAADMLTVVATYMILMKDIATSNIKTPQVGLLLVGNEEPGESIKWGTHHILQALSEKFCYKPQMMIVGERTGDGKQKIGKIEVKNRGIIRISAYAKSESCHTAEVKSLTSIDKILSIKNIIDSFIPKRENEWKTTFTMPYILSGEKENFNTAPAEAFAGFEIRPIPEDNMNTLIDYLIQKAKELNVDFKFINNERGIETNTNNALIIKLLNIIIDKYGHDRDFYIGKGKPHATQARFVPNGCIAIVFGQAGIGPHSAYEAHYIPSIMPYYNILIEFIGKYFA